jgi:hypothetical protein
MDELKFVSVEIETIRKAVFVCYLATQNTEQCIYDFKQQNTYRQKELFMLRELERDMEKIESLRNELEKILGHTPPTSKLNQYAQHPNKIPLTGDSWMI